MSSVTANSNTSQISLSKYGIILEEQKKQEPVTKPILKKESQISMQKTNDNAENDNLERSSAKSVQIPGSQTKLNKSELTDNYLAQSFMNMTNLLQNQLRKPSFMGVPGYVIPQQFPPQLNPYELSQIQQQSMMPFQFLLGQPTGIPSRSDGQYQGFDLEFGNNANSSQETTQDYEDMSSGGRVYKGTRRGGRLKVTDQPQVATYLREEKDTL